MIARVKCGARLLAALLPLLALADATAALPPPSPSPPVFQNRPFGPLPAPTPPRPSVVRPRTPEPIARGPIVAGTAFAMLAGGAVLFFAIRAWRISRLFGRQYLFRVRDKVPLRFGGERSGGLMATASFRHAGATPRDRSEPKDT